MVLQPIALAILILCRQYSCGMRAGCISPLMIWNGFPSNKNSDLLNLKACLTCADDGLQPAIKMITKAAKTIFLIFFTKNINEGINLKYS